MARKIAFKFRFPRGLELGLTILSFLFFIAMDYFQNFYQPSSPGDASNLFGVTSLLGMKAVYGFFLFFVLYNIGLFGIFSRALRKQSTSYKFDYVVGVMAFIGLVFILSAGIGAMYFSAEQGLPWFFNISQISIYHLGIFMQLLALMYFIGTD